ncbi:MAG: AAA family ATPase [Desulfobacterales bacterium]|nr:AAA family ATPase [Desulfobacterales bacterium]
MININGYNVIDSIYNSDIVSIYRAKRESDQKKVILKTLTHDYPNIENVNRLKHEYNVTKAFNNKNVIKSVSIEKNRNSYVAIFNDIGGISLNSYIEKNIIGIETFLKVAILVTEGLGYIHSKDIIHKDINPSNIIFSSIDETINIIDFSMSSSFSKENQKINYSNRFEGTIDYISPEQTGRMNRGIDYRTDYYSLGVTFYKLLTAELPFTAADTVGKIHAHIAKEAINPTELNNTIPQAISDIVLKLMRKNAEDRYQSSYGLIADLKNCLKQWKKNSSIVPFYVGSEDVKDQFRIPQKLYGREKEISIISNGFERISCGKTEITLISGYSGVGKTSLVNEIHKSIVKKRGYFVSGKSDKLKRDIPLGSLIQAFRKLIRQILTEEHDLIDNLKYELILSLKKNVRLMIEVIPELEIIVGKYPEVEELPVADSKNRFMRVFRNFIKVFATNERPLVVFIDDLQWVDSATINFIGMHLLDKKSKYIYLLGAYRDNEMDSAHPLMMMLNDFERSKLQINYIRLEPLNQKQVKLIIDETLNSSDKESFDLAELVFNKTDGNPFFVNEFLKNLFYNKLISYNYTNGEWTWDLETIKKEAITDNVVDLMIKKIRRLPDKIQEIIKTASCIGSRFNLFLLSKTSGKSKIETSELLISGIKEGLLYPENNDEYLEYLKDGFIEEEDDFDITYRFFHDRIHQAANLLLDSNKKKRIHLKIGEQLYSNSEFEEDEVFTIVNHLNISRFIINDFERKLDISRFNLLACRKAKKAAAYEQALNYARIGISLLEESDWGFEYDLVFSIYKELFECEYLNSNFNEADRLFEILINKARTRNERADIYMYKMNICGSLAENKEVIRLGILGLNEMGVNLEKKIKPFKLVIQSLVVRLLFIKNNKEKILNKKEINDPILEKKMLFFQKMVISSYFVNKKLMVHLILKIIKSSLISGNSQFSPYAYATYGSLIQVFSGRYKDGYELATIALELDKRYNDISIRCRMYGTFGAFISHWNRHIDENNNYLQKAFNLALECGDFVFAGFITSWIMFGRVLKGDMLENIRSQCENYNDFLKRIKDSNDINMHLNIQFVENLVNPDLNNIIFKDDTYDHEGYLATKNKIVISYYYLLKIKVCFILGHIDEGYKVIKKAEKIRNETFGLLQIVEHNFYNSLYLIALYDKVTKKEKRNFISRVRKNQKKLKLWTKNCEENNLHKYLLIEAELFRITGNIKKAEKCYEKSIESAIKNNFLQNEAISNELAAKFYISQKRMNLGKLHINDAFFAYSKWGASRKTRILQSEYPGLIGTESVDYSISSAIKNQTISDYSITIDMVAVMKATQTLSEEIVFDKLIDKLMSIVIENAGAHRGFLILKDKGKFVITAHIDDDNDIINGMRFENCDKISAAVINYVIRTRENLVLDDASVDGTFIYDNYISEKKPKSLICIPILYNSRFSGVLYLENNRVKGAFSEDRVEMLKILSSQAAISIENAYIYSKLKDLNSTLEKKVAERTKELSIKNIELQESLKDVKSAKNTVDKANTYKSEFLASISHQISTPMKSILGMTELALDNDYSEKTINYLKNIRVSAKYLLELLYEISEFSTIESGNTILAAKPLNIHSVIETMLTKYKIKAEKKNLIISAIVDKNIPEIVYGDSFRLEQILGNLMSNAVKFTEKGDIKISVSLNEKKEDYLVLKFDVSDTGIGIKESSIDKIFNPFIQEERSVTKKYGGTGLGLAISKEIVELMGGDISVENRKSGSVFSFTAEFRVNMNKIDFEKSINVNEKKYYDILINFKKQYKNEMNYLNVLLQENDLKTINNVINTIKKISGNKSESELNLKIEELSNIIDIDSGELTESSLKNCEDYFESLIKSIEEFEKYYNGKLININEL